MKNKFILIEDEELVAMSQKDMDVYRAKCYWKCQSCGHSMTYIDSLLRDSKPYVHEMKCPSTITGKNGKKILCNCKMTLNRSDGIQFESESFNELFCRYEKTIINESNFFDVNSDIFNDIYSSLCLVFFKAVSMFARTGGMKKTSNKWFKSFLHTVIKNKLVDIRKTASYVKRTPSVTCACCGKYVGQITVKHLRSNGHDEILENIMKNIGENVIKDSGEIIYYKNNEEKINKRSLAIGRSRWENGDDKKKDAIFKMQSLKSYYNLYPRAFFKNSILSTNENISEDLDFDIESQQHKAIDSDVSYEDKIMENINIDNAVDLIMVITFGSEESIEELSSFFDKRYSVKERMDIIKSILKDKISYSKLKNIESDRSFDGIAHGLTSAIFKIVKNDKKCKEAIEEKCLSK